MAIVYTTNVLYNHILKSIPIPLLWAICRLWTSAAAGIRYRRSYLNVPTNLPNKGAVAIVTTYLLPDPARARCICFHSFL